MKESGSVLAKHQSKGCVRKGVKEIMQTHRSWELNRSVEVNRVREVKGSGACWESKAREGKWLREKTEWCRVKLYEGCRRIGFHKIKMNNIFLKAFLILNANLTYY